MVIIVSRTAQSHAVPAAICRDERNPGGLQNGAYRFKIVVARRPFIALESPDRLAADVGGPGHLRPGKVQKPSGGSALRWRNRQFTDNLYFV